MNESTTTNCSDQHSAACGARSPLGHGEGCTLPIGHDGYHRASNGVDAQAWPQDAARVQEGAVVEVSAETMRNLEAIARLLGCNVETALEHVISEYVLPHGGDDGTS